MVAWVLVVLAISLATSSGHDERLTLTRTFSSYLINALASHKVTVVWQPFTIWKSLTLSFRPSSSRLHLLQMAVMPLLSKWKRFFLSVSVKDSFMRPFILLPSGPRGFNRNRLYLCCLNASMIKLTGTVIFSVRYVMPGTITSWYQSGSSSNSTSQGRFAGSSVSSCIL